MLIPGKRYRPRSWHQGNRSLVSTVAARALPAATPPRAAEGDQQLPPSDGDCHTPLPCEVRKGNDTTPRACGLHIQGGQKCWLLPPRWQIPVGPSKEPIQRSIVHLLGSAHLRRNPGMNFVMTLGVVLAGFWFDAAMAQEGYFGHDHDKWHHGFYQTLERPDTKSPCCNVTDCRPTSGRQVDGHYEVKVNGAWVSVPPGKILKQSAPDLGFHVCAPFKFDGQPDHLYCVVVPPET